MARDDAKDHVQNTHMRDQLWADLRGKVKDLDRISRILMPAASSAKSKRRVLRVRMSPEDAALIVQVLSLAQGEVHLRAAGSVV